MGLWRGGKVERWDGGRWEGGEMGRWSGGMVGDGKVGRWREEVSMRVARVIF